MGCKSTKQELIISCFSTSTGKMLTEENIQFLFKFSKFVNKQKKFTELNNS